MTQFATTRYIDQTAPGHMFSPAQERETESLCLPIAAQQLTITLAGTDPSVAGDYEISFPLPYGGTYVFTYTTVGAPLNVDAPAIAVAWNADSTAGKFYAASAAGTVITLVARSGNLSIAAGLWSGTKNGGTTVTIAQTVANGGSSLRMGVLYRYSPTQGQGPAITGTFRAPAARPAAPLATGVTAAQIRGVVAREENSTELESTFLSTQPDQYVAPKIFPGMNRGHVAMVVDPASGPINEATVALYAVLAAGTHTVIGALTDTADGANTVQVNTGADPLIRVLSPESTPVFQSPSQRLVAVKVNRTQ